jgi:hypothetical protein
MINILTELKNAAPTIYHCTIHISMAGKKMSPEIILRGEALGS